ncbi:sulfurtransferase [Thioflexithrix psekupsensis]|uniref:Sulfurtransferase n=2 Tax=Thioflexithrix psekupsensis TaxID=1570016 RepID=A0A251XCH8_9GAMM|nr:sulfurtransferase [Thioflexithrix psekupsensis]
MKRYKDFIAECLPHVREIMPWDLAEALKTTTPPLLLDVREGNEFAAFHIAHSLHVPRGILETACEYGYEETVPSLVKAREQEIVVICRSGNRSVLAAYVMQLMGYQNVCSLKTGLRGWNDYEQPLYDQEDNPVDPDTVDSILNQALTREQLGKV